MKIHRTLLVGLVAGVAAFAVSSCAYDPYYSGASYSSGGGGYGYGDGYGYGGSNFSTSFFVSTGNPRWGYDPYAGSYYDYNRRCYYDPHLYGYYPVGYRPQYVYGSPHPHGWRQGRGSIAPPSRIRSYNLTNYEDRASRYQNLGRDWSRNVRSEPSGRDQRDQRAGDGQGGFIGNGGERENLRPRPDGGGRYGNPGSGGFNRGGSDDERSRGDRGRGGSAFGGGNTSVAAPQAPPSRGGSDGRGGQGSDSAGRQAFIDRMNESRQRGGGDGGGRPMAPQVQPQPAPQPEPQAPQDGGRRSRPESDGGDGGGSEERRGRGVRGLGEG